MGKKWRPLDFDECFACGDDVEVFTDAPEGLVGDSDEVRCVVCHYPGWISVCDEDAYVGWCEDGYPAEAAQRIEKLEAQIKAFRAEIQDCRDAWAPDQPPSDLRQFLIDLESTLEQIS